MPDINRAAEIIYQCWKHGDAIDYVKADLWPDTIEEGYAMQAALASLREEPVKGWKIAATAEAGRVHINVDRPLAGRLFSSICHDDGATILFGRNRMAVAEAEFVFTLDNDLPPRDSDYTEDDVAESIRSLHPGLEIPDSRFRDFTLPGTAGLLADNACAANFVLGEATSEPFDPRLLADHPSSLVVNGEVVTTGVGGDALDGPLSALLWIANTLSQLGIGLKAGEFVTTGVTGKPSAIKRGDTVVTDLGKFGTATAVIS
ncbi:MAG: hypothetical protein KTR32_01685 [Granulosicoccus sp.]|nr:hypothetical protein [Granulosicoccus sp.]